MNTVTNSNQTNGINIAAQKEPIQEQYCSDYIYDPMICQTITMHPSFRKKRRKEFFDAVKFLIQKKLEHDYYSLEFQSDNDVHAELTVINSSPYKKRLNSLADGILRKIAEYGENLNRIYNYRMLDIHYEKNH